MFKEVQGFIAKKTDIVIENIQPDTQLVDLGLDSMKLLMMVMDFETEFKIQISDRQLEKLFTVDGLVKILEKS